MFPQRHVSFTTGLLELLKLLGLQTLVISIGDGVDKVVWQHERNSLATNSKLLLVMTQEMSKVYVENLPVYKMKGEMRVILSVNIIVVIYHLR